MTPLFPWRPDNRFELLVDGPVFFSRMLEAVSGARSYVFLELYLVKSGSVASRFTDALVEAAGRGVRVYVLLDDFGAMGFAAADRQRLRDAGIALEFYNRLQWRKRFLNLLRDHRKLLLVDGEVAFVGGAGVTDEFDPVQHPSERWRETMVEIRGPVVADWHTIFVSTWEACGFRAIDVPTPTPQSFPGGQRGRAVAGSRLQSQHVTRSVIVRVRAARRRVWIATAYFVPSWKLRRALTRAAQRGTDVRLLLPGPRTDHPAARYAGRRFFSHLLHHGIRIYEYQPRFLHAKVVLVDDWVSIGSSNLDRWNLHWNLEANQEVADPGFAAQVAAMLEADFAEAQLIEERKWRRRGLRARLLELWGGQLDRWTRLLG